jgi:hypothetical protein
MARKPKTDRERVTAYDRLVTILSRNCPLSPNPTPVKMRRWKRAYNALFSVAMARDFSRD